MQHYFCIRCENDCFFFEKDDIHHIKNVMRFKADDKVICIYNSKRFLSSLVFDKELIYAHKIEEIESISKNEIKVNLIIGLPKVDKFELILQKATELGVNTIVPFLSSRSVVRLESKDFDRKLERWNKIVKEASEQSERVSLPLITRPCKLDELKNHFNGLVLLADERLGRVKGLSIIDAIKNSTFKEITMIVGPEGGFSLEEFRKFDELGVTSVSLGTHILRSETAAIVGVGIVMALLENEDD